MKELDQLAASAGKASGKASDLGGAMEGTEEIRQWVSLRNPANLIAAARVF